MSIESLFSHKIVEVAVRSKAVVVFSVVWTVGSGSPLLKNPHFVLKLIINDKRFIPYLQNRYLCHVELYYIIFWSNKDAFSLNRVDGYKVDIKCEN